VERATGFEVSSAPEPVGYYIDQLLDRHKFYTMRDGANDMQTALGDGDLLEAGTAYEQMGLELRKLAQNEQIAMGVEESVARVKRYRDKGEVGYPMPWQEYTDVTLGWKPGEYGIIAARTGVGKTFMAVMHGHSVWYAGKRVLLISMEMDPELLHIRHDAYVAGVPLAGVWQKNLNKKQEKRYMRTMKALRDHGGFDIVGYNMAASMDQIRGTIEVYEPDFVIVDGAYLVRPTGWHPSMSRNERMESVALDMTSLATSYQVPVLNTVQFNRDQKKGKEDGDLSNVYGSDAWAQNAEYVWACIQTEQHKEDNTMISALLKHRNGPVFAARHEWDLEDMAFDLEEFQIGRTSLPRKKEAEKVEAGKDPEW
jgi:replicative DNA helicase